MRGRQSRLTVRHESAGTVTLRQTLRRLCGGGGVPGADCRTEVGSAAHGGPAGGLGVGREAGGRLIARPAQFLRRGAGVNCPPLCAKPRMRLSVHLRPTRQGQGLACVALQEEGCWICCAVADVGAMDVWLCPLSCTEVTPASAGWEVL